MRKIILVLLLFALIIFPLYAGGNRWTSKPPIGSTIDWSHPLSKGLVGCWLMNEGGGTPRDLVSKRNSNYVGGVVTGWRGGLKGYSPAFSGSTSLWVERDEQLEPAKVSAFAYLRRRGNNGQYSRPFGKTYNNGGSFPYLSYDIEYNLGGVGQNVINANMSTGSVLMATTNYTASDTTIPHVVGMTFKQGDVVRLWFNGIQVAVSAAQNSPIGYDTSSTGRFIIGGSSSASSANQWNGDIYSIYIFNRILSSQEIKQLYQDPYCFIKPPTMWSMFSTAVAAARRFFIFD